jgi:hypothetical protein
VTIQYRVLLPHPLEARLLLMHRDGDWRLPEWDESAERAWWQTEHVNRAVAARFGIESTVLRCVRDDEHRRLRIYELDNHSPPHDVPPGCTWIGRGELDLLDLRDDDTGALVDEWFRRNDGELPLEGAPWTRRGWYVEALAWAVARLNETGAATVEPPRQLRAWERAFLLRLRTERGSHYLRAVPEHAAHEARLVAWLAEHFAGDLPEIVACDADRGWYLQRVHVDGALLLEQVREEEEWYRAIRRLGEIQRAAAGHAKTLRAIGVPYRGLDVLAHRIPRLCDDADALMPARTSALSRAEAERLQSLVPALLSLCRELASFDLPDTLDHGNLTAASVLSSLAGPMFLDWSDGAIGHPFFSPGMLMADAVALLPASSRESRRRLRDSYTAAWADLADAPDLARAFDIARVLAPVHSAAAIHADVLPLAGYAWQLADLVPQRLRLALHMLVEEPAA